MNTHFRFSQIYLGGIHIIFLYYLILHFFNNYFPVSILEQYILPMSSMVVKIGQNVSAYLDTSSNTEVITHNIKVSTHQQPNVLL